MRAASGILAYTGRLEMTAWNRPNNSLVMIRRAYVEQAGCVVLQVPLKLTVHAIPKRRQGNEVLALAPQMEAPDDACHPGVMDLHMRRFDEAQAFNSRCDV